MQALSATGHTLPANSASATFRFVPGIRGGAVRITGTDCRYTAGAFFPRNAGTLAFWVRPHWDGTDGKGRYLFTLYGGVGVRDGYQRNRWSVGIGGRKLNFAVYGASGRPVSVETSVADWRAGEWRQVTATWTGINSGRADAEIALYVDGRPAGRQGGLRLNAGPVNEWFALGEDSDNSPDFADADFDELLLYARALSPGEILRGAAAVSSAPESRPGPIPNGGPRGDWWNDAWPFRCRVGVPPVKSGAEGAGRNVRLPLDLQNDIDAFGFQGLVDPASIRLVPCSPDTGRSVPGATPLPMRVEQDVIVWERTGRNAAAVMLYFGLRELDFSLPLRIRLRKHTWPLSPPQTLDRPGRDYAADTYGGDAWDFDEGDFEGIDQWGNKPRYLRNRHVANGILSFDVSTDPWFIWGDMWGQAGKTNRPVAIDLKRYPVLRMRIRQSCSAATWELYGRRRGGGGRLLHWKFVVNGTGWQTVRVDLGRQARWAGVLDAFRIDPTSEIAKAHVEIDWIRLTGRETPAVRGAVEVLPPARAVVGRVELEVPQHKASAGGRQALAATVRDQRGKPIRGWPVTLRFTRTSDGRFDAPRGSGLLRVDVRTVRGLTGADGRLAVVVTHGSRAGASADIIEARADFSAVAPERVAVTLVPGPPHHYRVAPEKAQILSITRFPFEVTVQLVDAADNPVALAGRKLRFSSANGPANFAPTAAVTDNAGRARTRLSVFPDKRWVYCVRVRDNAGLEGRSGLLAVIDARPKQDPISLLPNGYFGHADGRSFVPLGGFYANWVQTPTPDGEWGRLLSFTDTTDVQKRAWLRFLADNGCTAMRFMLRTHRSDAAGIEPMDVGGRVNRELFAEALNYLDLARKDKLHFLLVLHEDYTKPVYWNKQKFERYALPHFVGEDLDGLPPAQRRFIRDRRLLDWIGEKYTDPDAIACQDMYTRELIGALRNNPQVFAYELENEMVDCPASWVNHQIRVIREVDKRTPICVSHGGGGLSTADPLWWLRNTKIDFYTYHLYPSGRTTNRELDYGAATDLLARYGRMCGPCFLGESAGDQFRLHPSVETRRWTMRDIIWMSLANGNPGVFFWNARGPEVREFRLAREALSYLHLATFERARPEIGIDVRHPLDDDKFYRTPAGRRAYTVMGKYVQYYLNEGVDFDFTLEPERYPLRAGLAQFAPPRPSRRPFRVSPGWQLKYLADRDWREGLVYIRNLAGIERWDSETGRRRRTQYLRRRRASLLTVEFRLPGDGTYALRIYDLDRQSVTRRKVPASHRLDLGTTDHDFAVVFARSTAPDR
ncbi:MAG: LamG domain-containing protein [Kiritimatiellaeota bacterium]|nr:LamG domain-containing protein [Kiritimatiellota bacterium]